MPPRTLHILMPLIAAVIVCIPTIARAGDAPIFVVKGWGVGTIDNRFMLYLGKDRYLDTPIPSTPKWVVSYAFLTGLLLGGFVVRAHYRRHNQTLQRTGAARRGFEVQEVSGSGPGR